MNDSFINDNILLGGVAEDPKVVKENKRKSLIEYVKERWDFLRFYLDDRSLPITAIDIFTVEELEKLIAESRRGEH